MELAYIFSFPLPEESFIETSSDSSDRMVALINILSLGHPFSTNLRYLSTLYQITIANSLEKNDNNDKKNYKGYVF